ncbi:hypothetical protein C6P42_003940 [Pichia californica]|nr:hypothetical protein C6P42_003940 [[Candida] californica]
MLEDRRSSCDLDNISKRIIEAFGGPKAGKFLFTGKIMGVKKKSKVIYGYGIVELESIDDQKNRYTIPFKSENIVVTQIYKDNAEEVLCSVPDLIILVDTDGNAVGTQDYRYDLFVHVIAFAPAPQWMTLDGIIIGGTPGFAKEFYHIKYKPIGVYIPPVPFSAEF